MTGAAPSLSPEQVIERLRRPPAEGAPARGDGPTAIEQLLSRPDGDDVPLDRLRRAMTTVVLGREAGADGADFCELTRALPEDA